MAGQDRPKLLRHLRYPLMATLDPDLNVRRRALIRLAAAAGLARAGAVVAQTPPDARQRHVETIREKQALHIGTLAYIWGFPMVDMAQRMHNETHRIASTQRVASALNRFHRNENLITPATSEGLRAPNNDTLYFSGWFDLSAEPVIVQVPDTAGRYYTLAITDFFNEVIHLGRRTTGTAAQAFALLGPQWQGSLPAGVRPVPLATRTVWILGRLAVAGEHDLPAARSLLRGFWSVPLSQWRPGQPPPTAPELPPAGRADALRSLAYFEWLNRWLRDNRPRPGEEAMVRMFDQIGIGPRSEFRAERLDEATRRGLEAAIAEGQALLRASSQQPLKDVRNGWIFPLGLADYGEDYLMRAGVAYGGYANRPEETVYAARTVDDRGQLMSGAQRYRLHFPKGQLPPVGAFWSISAYDLHTFMLIENPIRRYSIGDRTAGLAFGADGSLTLDIAKDPPPTGHANWLPVGEAPFSLIVRLYEPAAEVLDGRYRLPPLELVA